MCGDCPICMAPLFPQTTCIMRLKKKILVRRGERLPVTKLKCGHTYHNSCIKEWFMKTEIESSDKCPMCRDKIRFKKNSKDFMMNKLRWGDPSYEYGDEHIFDVETDSSSGSDYTTDSSSDAQSNAAEWEEAWDEAVEAICEHLECNSQDLDEELGEGWETMLVSFLDGDISMEDVWDWIGEREEMARQRSEIVDRVRVGQERVWGSVVERLNDTD